MQSIIAWAHFLSLVFLEALSVTEVALSDGGGGRGFSPWGRKTWCLKWCSSSCCKCDEGGLRWHGWRDEELISPKKETHKQWQQTKGAHLYLHLWKQDMFPRSFTRTLIPAGRQNVTQPQRPGSPLTQMNTPVRVFDCWNMLARKDKLPLSAFCLI